MASAMVIEVVESEEMAAERAAYYRVRGFTVEEPGFYEWVRWSNTCAGGGVDHNTASDPIDNQVWTVVAKK